MIFRLSPYNFIRLDTKMYWSFRSTIPCNKFLNHYDLQMLRLHNKNYFLYYEDAEHIWTVLARGTSTERYHKLHWIFGGNRIREEKMFYLGVCRHQSIPYEGEYFSKHVCSLAYVTSPILDRCSNILNLFSFPFYFILFFLFLRICTKSRRCLSTLFQVPLPFICALLGCVRWNSLGNKQ